MSFDAWGVKLTGGLPGTIGKDRKMNKFILGMIATAVTVPAFAAVPAAVSTALTDAGTDSLLVAGIVLAVIVGIFAVKLMRKAL